MSREVRITNSVERTQMRVNRGQGQARHNKKTFARRHNKKTPSQALQQQHAQRAGAAGAAAAARCRAPLPRAQASYLRIRERPATHTPAPWHSCKRMAMIAISTARSYRKKSGTLKAEAGKASQDTGEFIIQLQGGYFLET